MYHMYSDKCNKMMLSHRKSNQTVNQISNACLDKLTKHNNFGDQITANEMCDRVCLSGTVLPIRRGQAHVKTILFYLLPEYVSFSCFVLWLPSTTFNFPVFVGMPFLFLSLVFSMFCLNLDSGVL